MYPHVAFSYKKLKNVIYQFSLGPEKVSSFNEVIYRWHRGHARGDMQANFEVCGSIPCPERTKNEGNSISAHNKGFFVGDVY